jgi:hypothetical protein
VCVYADLTQWGCVWSWTGESGHHLIAGACVLDHWRLAMIVEPRGHGGHPVTVLAQVRLVALTNVSSQRKVDCLWSLMALFHGGFYLSPMAGSSSLSWPFALT